MYNHYIPQSDGSYRRNAVPDQRRQPKPKPEPPNQTPPPPPPKQEPAPPPCPPTSGNILDFFRNLLPREIDTADLLIIFLLLLMNKDDEGGLSPILTLALYFLL